MKKVYLAGPMRGLPNNNKTEFNSWADALREIGYEVSNPAEIEVEAGNLREAFRLDVNELLLCDAVVVIHGWTFSLGARAEVSLALAVGIPVYRMNRDGHILWEVKDL